MRKLFRSKDVFDLSEKFHKFQKTTFFKKMWFFAICGFWGCPINKMMKNKVKEHKNRHHLVVSFLKNNQ